MMMMQDNSNDDNNNDDDDFTMEEALDVAGTAEVAAAGVSNHHSTASKSSSSSEDDDDDDDDDDDSNDYDNDYNDDDSKSSNNSSSSNMDLSEADIKGTHIQFSSFPSSCPHLGGDMILSVVIETLGCHWTLHLSREHEYKPLDSWQTRSINKLLDVREEEGECLLAKYVPMRNHKRIGGEAFAREQPIKTTQTLLQHRTKQRVPYFQVYLIYVDDLSRKSNIYNNLVKIFSKVPCRIIQLKARDFFPNESVPSVISDDRCWVDRCAILYSELHEYKNKPVLVIDCGTMIKIAASDSHGTLWGGSLTAGLGRKFLAIHEAGEADLIDQQDLKQIISEIMNGERPRLPFFASTTPWEQMYVGVLRETAMNVIAFVQSWARFIQSRSCGSNGDDKEKEKLPELHVLVTGCDSWLVAKLLGPEARQIFDNDDLANSGLPLDIPNLHITAQKNKFPVAASQGVAKLLWAQSTVAVAETEIQQRRHMLLGQRVVLKGKRRMEPIFRGTVCDILRGDDLSTDEFHIYLDKGTWEKVNAESLYDCLINFSKMGELSLVQDTEDREIIRRNAKEAADCLANHVPAIRSKSRLQATTCGASKRKLEPPVPTVKPFAKKARTTDQQHEQQSLSTNQLLVATGATAKANCSMTTRLEERSVSAADIIQHATTEVTERQPMDSSSQQVQHDVTVDQPPANFPRPTSKPTGTPQGRQSFTNKLYALTEATAKANDSVQPASLGTDEQQPTDSITQPIQRGATLDHPPPANAQPPANKLATKTTGMAKQQLTGSSSQQVQDAAIFGHPHVNAHLPPKEPATSKPEGKQQDEQSSATRATVNANDTTTMQEKRSSASAQYPTSMSAQRQSTGSSSQQVRDAATLDQLPVDAQPPGKEPSTSKLKRKRQDEQPATTEATDDANDSTRTKKKKKKKSAANANAQPLGKEPATSKAKHKKQQDERSSATKAMDKANDSTTTKKKRSVAGARPATWGTADRQPTDYIRQGENYSSALDHPPATTAQPPPAKNPAKSKSKTKNKKSVMRVARSPAENMTPNNEQKRAASNTIGPHHANKRLSAPQTFTTQDVVKQGKELVNRRVAKNFDIGNGPQVFFGTVSSYDAFQRWWLIIFDDGDQEDLDSSEMVEALNLYEKSKANDTSAPAGNK